MFSALFVRRFSISILLYASFLLVGSVGLQAGERPVAVVMKVKGESRITRAGRGAPSAIKIHTLVSPGDFIRVEKSSWVDVQFSTGIICRLGSMSSITEVKVGSFQNQEGSVRIPLTLIRGEVAGAADKLLSGESFQVKTPTAVASVRGTEFIVQSENETTELLVNRGAVHVLHRKTGGESVVDVGRKAILDASGLRESIMEQFEKDRFRMFRELNEVRSNNFRVLIKQIMKNRSELDRIRSGFESPRSE